MLTIRLRSRDGLERLQLAPDATVWQLKEAVSKLLDRPVSQFMLSTDKNLLTSKSPEACCNLQNDWSTLQQAGFANGQMVYCYYDGERVVAPGYSRSAYELRPFGAHMDVEQLMARQTRIERQDKPVVASASFDRFAAHAFQAYVQSALAFSIKRVGLLYGRVDDEKNVFVDAIYEPDQSGSATHVAYDRESPLNHAAQVVATHLGLQKVGFIFNQSAARSTDYIMSNEEICQMCEVQDEVGEHCVSAVFVQEEVDGQVQVNLEAFQCSQQAVKLWREGWFVRPAAGSGDTVTGTMRVRNPHDASVALPVMISGRDTDEVDNDFFLAPVAVKDHVGPLLTSFPPENRLVPQGMDELKAHLQRHAAKPYTERLADFHLLLWLASNGFDLNTDIALLADAVVQGQPIREGYKVMIDTMAGVS